MRASVVNPHTQKTTYIEIKSQPERHTINKAELAAITVALDLHKHLPQIRILTDTAFCISTIRNYDIDPLNFIRHPTKTYSTTPTTSPKIEMNKASLIL